VPLVGTVSVCPRCGLTWRAPSTRAIRVEAGAPGTASRSMAFRPRAGEVLATMAGMLLFAPIAIAVATSAFDGGLRSGTLLGSEMLGRVVEQLALVLVACGGLLLLAHAAALAGRLVAPRRVSDDAEVLLVRPGGLGKQGRAELRLAKLDLREVVLEPHTGGYLHDLYVVHRAGPALCVATELPKETAERLGMQLRSWLGPEAALEYRKATR
jgi:hypothetical protein